MKPILVEPFDRTHLLDRVRQTRLRGFDRRQVYRDAVVELAPPTSTDAFTPAQNYVLRPTVDTILALRANLLDEGIDLFALDGGAHVRMQDNPDEVVPVIPPVVEESREPDGRTVLVVNDGLHRLFAARSVGLPISVVLIRDVPPDCPYYAYALRDGWSQVAELDELPDTHQKKEYRVPGNYKALFRDFNEQFPGVQKQRKRSNPAHISE
ncbi:hypothetical protein UO65_0491 [Actinokineospora spheciospongiae]|uniref:ParB-like catalytic effector domain-containing protein n=1 Tax=Actinokineospora spheciospongiae TaxID=909613 RepID=W7ITE7_9PSEU|nr:hypothetical protein [Actinokineospora spheciospongiae]EWC64165.1 hypothetical protein UO65_0491 [Actinokineospora spheciospongiae]